ASADVTDEARLREVMATAQHKFGPLNGVIHAAGAPSGGLIQVKTATMVKEVFAPKAAGLFALMNLLKDQSLELIALCSTTVSVVGGFGQVDHCAVNAFLDQFAHQ